MKFVIQFCRWISKWIERRQKSARGSGEGRRVKTKNDHHKPVDSSRHEREQSFPKSILGNCGCRRQTSAPASPTVTAPACRIHFSSRQEALFSDVVEIWGIKISKRVAPQLAPSPGSQEVVGSIPMRGQPVWCSHWLQVFSTAARMSPCVALR